ncbi:MAG: hypothetical protein J6R18_01120 [Kiritimatiellae bacterium]|nr:hypothetical protein [Kiritimatiellia bacterium]
MTVSINKKIALVSVLAALAGCATMNQKNEADEILISSPAGSATVSLIVARVLSWKDSKGSDLFFMPCKQWSPDGDWSHGGTSLCWPWFGRKGTEQRLIHGYARNERFEFRCRQAVPGGESITLGLKASECNKNGFCGNADVELTVSIADSLSVKLKTTNIGDKPITLTEGLQSYFKASDYSKITFFGIEANEFAAVNGMDKAFATTGKEFGFKNSADGSEFRMKSSGNSSVVVWTPGNVEPANRNLAVDDCPKFIVVGPSVRPAEGAVVVQPGQSHELTFEIRHCK